MSKFESESAFKGKRVLVVGTTCDYIDMLRRSRPGRCIFITDAVLRQRSGSLYPTPANDEELCCSLNDFPAVCSRLRDHLERYSLIPDGIVSYDCESMLLASFLAPEFGLEYPAPDGIRACRRKDTTNKLWHAAGLDCPQSSFADSIGDALNFFEMTGGPCVLKPETGAGSELTFLCCSLAEVRTACTRIQTGLEKRRRELLYDAQAGGSSRILMQEYIAGTEYSCDFIVLPDRVQIIRMCRKYHANPARFPREQQAYTFGITEAYELFPPEGDSPRYPSPLPRQDLEQILGTAALAAGIRGIICMADFIATETGRTCLLEMAPRPAGDCIPWMLRTFCATDILALTIDAAAGIAAGTSSIPAIFADVTHGCLPAVGLRIFASRKGTINRFDLSALHADPRVNSVYLRYTPPHTVVLPPSDYESRILGYILYRPHAVASVESQNKELTGKLGICWND
jgi:biotin carboxylase